MFIKKRKITKASIEELAKRYPQDIISDEDARSIIGGTGSYSYVYSYETYDWMDKSGLWDGGYVKSLNGETSYAIPSVTIEAKRLDEGMFGSYYIGPTSDYTMSVMPAPKHAADYIAMLHDKDYQYLGLDGFTGMLSLSSRQADDLLITRCEDMLDAYDRGEKLYNGYAITGQAVIAAQSMKAAFLLEQGITGIFQ